MATKPQVSAKLVSEQRAILGPTGNRVRASEDPKRKTEAPKKQQRPRKVVQEIPAQAVRNNVSVDSCSSDSSASSGSSAKKLENSRRNVIVRRNGVKNANVVPDGTTEVAEISPKASGPIKRCDWITPNSGTRVFFFIFWFLLMEPFLVLFQII